MTEIKLFDYQEEMVRRVQEAFANHNSVMVQMPTGTGKTHVLAAIVGLFLKQRVWVVAHRRELVSQVEDTLGRFFPALGPDAIRVTSIQWLSRHYREIKEQPGLIVVDEAHHALAETYAEVINAYPKAKKLGLTATPYRLNGKGFTDLFDTLLCSWSMERFIAEGRLSLYDYYSVKPDGADQLLVDSLQRRGADGDYLLKELNEVMDVRPSLERLCLTVKAYVPGKKGIVYAISIQHAEHIAAFYRGHGIKAVAISCMTPLDERKKLIERFKWASRPSAAKDDEIEVLVSVDLFSEGFDCPDVEFIQLARPTLSLAKYMQMVGRGLRVAEGKSYCVILDNVGLYKRFGLPSVDRDWQRMFEGQTSLDVLLQEACMHVNRCSCVTDAPTDGDDEMMRIVNHEWQQQRAMLCCSYSVVEDDKGLLGIKDKDGNMVLDCMYKKIDVTNDGFAFCCMRKKAGRKEWVDLRNGLWFERKPQSVRLLGIDFCTVDGKRLYPRIRSRFVDEKAFLTVKTLELQVGTGLCWKRRFIPWDNPDKVYCYKEGMNDLRLYCDDEDNYVVQENIGSRLVPVPSQEFMTAFCRQCAEKSKKEQVERQVMEQTAGHYDEWLSRKGLLEEGRMEKDDIVHVKGFYNKKDAWVDMVTKKIFLSKPTTFRRGFVSVVKEGHWCYVRNIPGLADTPFRQWEIRADDNICVIDNDLLFVKENLLHWYKVCRRTDDFTCFLVKEWGKHADADKDQEILITQFDGEGLKMTQNGMPYRHA